MYGLVHFVDAKMYELVHSVNRVAMMRRSIAVSGSRLRAIRVTFVCRMYHL